MDNQTTLESPSLRDQLESAVESVSEAPEVVESEVTEAKSDRPRDESGKFKKTEEVTEEAPKVEVQEEVVAEVKPAKPRPSSWKKDYEESWGKLDPALQDYIAQREADFAKGVSTYKNQWDQAQPILSSIEKFAPVLQQNGVDPAQWINSLGTAHQTLVYGNPEQKLQMFAQLANDYGVDLNGLTGGQGVSPQFSMIAQELSQIKNQWQQFQSQQEQQEQAQLKSEIDSFSKDKPYFDDVRETMAGLLQNNMASDLNTAYDKAIRLHDDIWQKIQSEQTKSSQTEQKSRIAAVKAKAISPKSSSPTANVSLGGKGNNLRDQLASIVDTFSSENI